MHLGSNLYWLEKGLFSKFVYNTFLQRNVLSFAHCYHSTNCSECQMALLKWRWNLKPSLEAEVDDSSI